MRTLPPGDRWLSPQQAALRLRIGVRTLAAYARAGRIEFETTPTGSRRYRLSTVNAVLDEQDGGEQ